MEYLMWWFYLLHEAYHNKHMDDFQMLKDKNIDCRSLLGSINNIAMDFKIETVNRGEFAGRDRLVHKARYQYAADHIYREIGKGKRPDVLRDKLEAVWVHDALCRISWIPEYKTDDLPGLLTPEGLVWLEKILSYPELSSLYSAQKTAQDTYDVTILLLRALELDPKDPEVNELPEESTGASASGDGEEGEEDGAPASGWVKFSEMFVDNHDLKENSNREHSLHIEYDVPGDGQWVPMEFRKLNLDKHYIEPIADNRLERALREQFSHCNLSKKIRRELQAITRTRFEAGKRRGRLHKRSLHKSVNDDARLFKQRQVRFTPKGTSVMLLQDWSGSMGRTKFKNASAATHEMGRVLNSLQIPFAIHGFSTVSCSHNYEMQFKTFNESWNSEKFIHRCITASHNMHCNADGDYLLKAGAELMAQKSARKILFVLSDGSPAAADKHGSCDPDTFTAKVIKQLESTPGLEVYAIGIEDRNVTRLYKHNCSINNSSELEDKLLNVLRHKIISQIGV
jgi:hypothetical protein